MDIAYALAPVIATLLLALAGRGFVVSCSVGLGLALLGAALSDKFAFALADVPETLAGASVLMLNVFVALAAGLYLSSILDKRGAIKKASNWAAQSGLPRGRLAVVLALGMGPLAGSGAGFGASFLLTIPILQQVIPDSRALGRIGILGANIVPWGALALPSLVGAEIAGLTLSEMTATTSLTSCLVFPFLACLAVLATPKQLRDESLGRALAFAIVIGVWIPLSLWVHSAHLVPQSAGPLTSLSTIVLSVALSWRRLRGDRGMRWRALRGLTPLMTPYILLACVIGAMRIVPPVWDRLEAVVLLEAGGFALRPFVNPALAILAVTALLGARFRPREVALAARRGLKPALSVLAFATLSQTMRATGMIAWVAEEAGSSWHSATHVVVTPLVGLFSAIATGSGLAAHALVMEGQASLGASVGASRLYAAAQNSASGHAILASLNMAAIMQAVAKAQPNATQPEPTAKVLRYGLAVALGDTLMVSIAFGLLLAWGFT